MMGREKLLCKQCNLNGHCWSQKNNKVEKCGMEDILEYNKQYNKDLKNRVLTRS